MLLLETVIKDSLIKTYDEINDMHEACGLVEREFHGIKISEEIDGDCYKINLYSSINNTPIGIINNIQIKK